MVDLARRQNLLQRRSQPCLLIKSISQLRSIQASGHAYHDLDGLNHCTVVLVSLPSLGENKHNIVCPAVNLLWGSQFESLLLKVLWAILLARPCTAGAILISWPTM